MLLCYCCYAVGGGSDHGGVVVGNEAVNALVVAGVDGCGIVLVLVCC